MKRIIEGRWDCSYCDTKGILGGKRQCPNCGRVRDKDFDLYLPKDRKASYVPEDVAKNINRNPDWMCSFCGSYCSDDDTACSCCGAPRSEEDLNYFDIKRKQEAEKNKVESKNDFNFYSDLDKESTISESSSLSSSSSKKNFKDIFKKPIFSFSLISICIILLISGLIYLLIPREVSMKVSELSWSRSINIERLQPVIESGWYLPSGAELIYTSEEFHHNERVYDYTETYTTTTINNLGNGYFEEDEQEHKKDVYVDVPVFETKYYYYIDKWLYERSIHTSGSDKFPYWGDVLLSSDERISGKSSSYKITGTTEDGKVKTFSISYDDWETIQIGQNVKLKVSLGVATLIK